MEYEELQAIAVEIMASEESGVEGIWAQGESFKGSGIEALILGAVIGAGFGDQPGMAGDFLLAVSAGCQEFEDYQRIIEIANASVPGFDPFKMLEATSELTTLESIMVGICFGGGFVGAEKGLTAIANLSEIAGIGYTSEGLRGDYRAPLPDWLTADCEEV